MALIGRAAMLLWYDIEPAFVAEHDEWHTREHFPERVGIPGFLRAQRWVARGATAPRYLVCYEVRDLGVLSSDAYRERLDHPSEWTRRMMPHFRGMVRGFCRLERSVGDVLGSSMLSLRFSVDPGREASFDDWLREECLPAVAGRPGFASAFLLRGAATPVMTAEQALRGRDESVDRALLVSAYADDFVEALRSREFRADALEARGARAGGVLGAYSLACRADAAALRAS